MQPRRSLTPAVALAGIEPHDWMWLATCEELLNGWTNKKYETSDLGNNRRGFDADAIRRYSKELGETFDLTRYRGYSVH